MITEDVLKMTIPELQTLSMKLAIQYANGILNKEIYTRATIAINDIIKIKKDMLITF